MPKTTKEITEKEIAKKDKSTSSDAKVSKSKKKPTSKASASKKTSTTKSKTKTKKEEPQKESLKKSATTKSKSPISKTTKKETVKKDLPKKSTAKATKKSTTKKAVSKKSVTSKKVSSKKRINDVDILEYYDLPYRYNKTIVKVLAQTPKTLFVYWDISDSDRQNYIELYGKNFFENTKPILIIHNTTMNYSFEIEINDFANCWYFNINDEKCEYLVELGRRPKQNNIPLPNNYLYITSSNKIESPNGHILFEKTQKTLFYRNIKTNEVHSKDVATLEFIQHFGKIYNVYETYKKIYKDENLTNINNPSSKFN